MKKLLDRKNQFSNLPPERFENVPIIGDNCFKHLIYQSYQQFDFDSCEVYVLEMLLSQLCFF